MGRSIFRIFMLFTFLVWHNQNLKAQFVTITDANFAIWLTDNYPSCMNGFDLDTTCSEIISETFVSVGGLDISDLTGIQYFNNLVVLDCSTNQLSGLPPLPNSIQTLLCDNNQLSSLPILPEALDLFYCSQNNLISLPTLPSLLTDFQCFDNQLTSLPELPESLLYFDCSNNLLSEIPTLPSSLIWLQCNINLLTSLPELPQTIQILLCTNNSITELPVLSSSLETLDCSNNLLTALPDLQSTLALTCDNNQLFSLPALPAQLYSLICNNNQLNGLPTLPDGIQWLQCSNNNISCFPIIPESIGFSPVNFNISNNPFICLPNYIPAMGAEFLSIPLCITGNDNGCDGSNNLGIVGKIYQDENSNCELDVDDNLHQNVQIKLYNTITEDYVFTNSAINGLYSFSENPGIFLISIDTLNTPYTVNCVTPGMDSTVVLTSTTPLVSDINFDIKCKEGLDLNVQSIVHQNALIFPGLQHTLQVMVGGSSHWYGLDCATGTSGQVTIVVDGPISFDGVAPGALTPQVNGNIFTYEIADFAQVNNASDFLLFFLVDTTAQNGDLICVTAEVTSTDSEINSSNNVLEYCYSVVNSYDPNYKEVYPVDVLPGFEDYFVYTIHFQNLGTAPAINIRVLDTLDNNLNLETFEVINYSHFNTATLANGIVNFRFPNIFLPDSLSNPEGSQGFVQYKIKPLSNLPVGTEIENTAHIFFDYNPAIITNTTVNTYLNVLSSFDSNKSLRLGVHPNPSTGEIFITDLDKNLNYSLIISDLSGRIFKTERVSGKSQINWLLNDLKNGVYFITASSEFSSKTVKLILTK
ncbi:MAG: T9SS type A sorting domain-containing protein [Bacteroidia bacterium]